jgi:alkanesulfonate monooxygenase SsuD/methylene tetrahydromethanopterin reductase-like flavin-dependent oxidoreductase (luciferase family)
VPNKEGVRDGIALYRETLEAAGHDPASRDVAGVFQMYCGESDAHAHSTAGGSVIRYLEFFSAIDRRSPHRSKAYEHHQGGSANMYAGVTSEMLSEQRLALIGDPATLCERIRWAEDFYGLNYLLLEVGQGGLPHAEVVASLTRFANEVMPRFA